MPTWLFQFDDSDMRAFQARWMHVSIVLEPGSKRPHTPQFMMESASNQAALVDVATWTGLPCRQTPDCRGSSEIHLAVLHNTT